MNPVCASCLRASRIAIRRTAGRSRTTSQFANSSKQTRSMTTTIPQSKITARSRLLTPSTALTQQRLLSTTIPHRTAASTGPTSPKPSPSQSNRTIAVLNPRKDPDDETKEMSITLTPRATTRLRKIMSKDANPSLCLRVTVESGGCHGFQYLMSLTSAENIDVDEDTLFVAEEPGMDTVEGGDSEASIGRGRAKVVMDEASLELLKGSSVDFSEELIGSQFLIVGNPRAVSSCGCGTSFDVKI